VGSLSSKTLINTREYEMRTC